MKSMWIMIYLEDEVIILDDEMKEMLVKLLEGQNRLESEVRKNSIKLETIEKNINEIEILERRPV